MQEGCPGERQDIRDCALDISDAGYTSLQDFVSAGKTLLPQMVRAKAVVKACLRRSMKQVDREAERGPVAISIAKGAPSMFAKTASAEEAFTVTRLSKATRQPNHARG